MTNKGTWPVLLIACLAMPIRSEAAWSLTPTCGPGRGAEYRAFEQRLRKAEAGGPEYLPHPFPKTKAEIIEDFTYGLRRGLGEPVGDSDRLLLNAIEAERTSYRITSVADWTPLHCGRREPRPSFFIVQIFVDGKEVTRATVAPSGLIGSVLSWADGPFKDNPPRLPSDPEDLVEESGQPMPAKAHDFQYVSVWGTVRCDDLVPCVAFRSASAVYLWWWEPALGQAALYRVDVEGRRYSQREAFRSPQAKRELLEQFRGSPRELITLGGDVMAEAVEVAGQASR